MKKKHSSKEGIIVCGPLILAGICNISAMLISNAVIKNILNITEIICFTFVLIYVIKSSIAQNKESVNKEG